jgi:hypothetical protein
VLQWNQDWGAKAEYWEGKVLAGQRAPDPFYERPEIDEASVYLWRAFIDLGTERQVGMGLGPIPRSAAKAYAAEIGLSGDCFDHFWAIINTVDNEYLKFANASDKESEVNSGRNSNNAAARAQPVSRK